MMRVRRIAPLRALVLLALAGMAGAAPARTMRVFPASLPRASTGALRVRLTVQPSCTVELAEVDHDAAVRINCREVAWALASFRPHEANADPRFAETWSRAVAPPVAPQAMSRRAHLAVEF